MKKIVESLNQNKKVYLLISKNDKGFFTRITKKSPKKVKKFFLREYDNPSKKLLKLGLKEGLNELSIEELLGLLEKIPTKKEVCMKNINKMIKNKEINHLKNIPKTSKKFMGEIRAKLMKINHAFLKKGNIRDFSSFDFSALPIQGFKEKEIHKYLDIR